MLDDPLLQRLLGEKVFAALCMWSVNANYKIELQAPLATGNSGVKIFDIILRNSREARRAVLKHCSAGIGEARYDTRGFQRATVESPKQFADLHLAGLRDTQRYFIPDGAGGWFLISQYPSAERATSYVTLTELSGTYSFGQACRYIVSQALGEWNQGPLTTDRVYMTTLQEFLREILREKCEPGGDIYSAVMEVIEPGRPLPWPLEAVATPGWAADVQLLGIRGNAHGDLHSDDILVPISYNKSISLENIEKFVLLDLSIFRTDRLLAADPVYLLLSAVSLELPELSAEARERLTDFVLAENAMIPEAIPDWLGLAIHAIHNAGYEIYSRYALGVEWRRNSLAALAACALLLVGREENNDSRRWFLELTERALQQLGVTNSSLAGSLARKSPGAPARVVKPPERLTMRIDNALPRTPVPPNGSPMIFESVFPTSYREHAFISYVKEDRPKVFRLKRNLEAAEIPVWLDADLLRAGEDWRQKIRDAITQNARVFIICFSHNSAARQKSYQREELMLAVEEFRLRKPDVPWLIPVRFDDCDVPDVELYPGRRLESIHRADLFGRKRPKEVGKLIETIKQALKQEPLPIQVHLCLTYTRR